MPVGILTAVMESLIAIAFILLSLVGLQKFLMRFLREDDLAALEAIEQLVF